MKRFVSSLVLAAAICALPRPSAAQQYLPAASAYVGSGLEGGGRGFQRARTRLRLGFELRMDEAPEDALVVAGLVDLEPRAAFGADLRYVRSLGPNFALSAGAVGYFVPATLFGPCAGLEVRIPMSKRASFVAGPDVAVFALGTDLPDGIVIWQALMQGGLRVDF
ncbi:MAG: hypothetical protein KF819_07105 [Labilithrix sp.]|nr:hypothetical protein [Labilithrix sp.]